MTTLVQNPVRYSFQIPSAERIRDLRSLPFVPEIPPDRIRVGAEYKDVGETWEKELLSAKAGTAAWGEFADVLVAIYKNGVIKIVNQEAPLAEAGFPGTLLETNFEVAVVGDTSDRWPDEYSAPGLADGHDRLSFACAFKSSGHNRLVSRRWLKYGPWRLIRNEEQDFSFIQFHDLNADAETALEQAKPGHERMGISDHGGFLQRGYVYETDFDGIYLPDEEILEIVVHGRKIPDVELLDACALRHYQDLDDDKPLKNVRYVFVGGEQQASKYLHELWLRELECWAIVDGDKVRLDEDYEPPAPEKPDWVTKIEDEEGK